MKYRKYRKKNYNKEKKILTLYLTFPTFPKKQELNSKYCINNQKKFKFKLKGFSGLNFVRLMKNKHLLQQF
jgi:hypothetical protein